MKNQLLKENEITLSTIIKKILEDTKQWQFINNAGKPWFRGQSVEDSPIPNIFRSKYDEFNMATMFRNRASSVIKPPENKRLDKWLFLMQHYGIPTRLLDWTENLFAALLFALEDYFSKVKKCNNLTLWVLHPFEMNKCSGITGFPNTWTRKKNKKKPFCKKHNYNPGLEYFRLAFHPKSEYHTEINLKIINKPIAVQSNYLDQRQLSQKSCFTIHGNEEEDFETIFKGENLIINGYFLKYIIPKDDAEKLYSDLLKLGVSRTSIYPDLNGLALELKNRFKEI